MLAQWGTFVHVVITVSTSSNLEPGGASTRLSCTLYATQHPNKSSVGPKFKTYESALVIIVFIGMCGTTERDIKGTITSEYLPRASEAPSALQRESFGIQAFRHVEGVAIAGHNCESQKSHSLLIECHEQ